MQAAKQQLFGDIEAFAKTCGPLHEITIPLPFLTIAVRDLSETTGIEYKWRGAYIVGAFATEKEALEASFNEKAFRGGKYGCAIINLHPSVCKVVALA